MRPARALVVVTIAVTAGQAGPARVSARPGADSVAGGITAVEQVGVSPEVGPAAQTGDDGTADTSTDEESADTSTDEESADASTGEEPADASTGDEGLGTRQVVLALVAGVGVGLVLVWRGKRLRLRR